MLKDWRFQLTYWRYNWRDCALRFLRDRNEAQDLVEYALLASLVAVASGLFAPELTESMGAIYSKLSIKLTEAGG
jgi:Flp pilus assembly pilin Flp